MMVRFLRWLFVSLVMLTSGLIASRQLELQSLRLPLAEVIDCDLLAGHPSANQRGFAMRAGWEISDRARPDRGTGSFKKAAPRDGDGPPPKGLQSGPAHLTFEFLHDIESIDSAGHPESGDHPHPHGGLEPEQGGHRGPPLG